MDGPSGKQECKVNCCAKPAVVALESRDLCLDHFLGCRYERLDQLEPLVRRRSLEKPENLAAAAFLVECSNRALLISLRHESLSNLDRSRLLNILLLSGDLQSLLDKPLLKNEDSVSDRSRFLAGLQRGRVLGQSD
jgi:hypothetical protein